MSTGRTTIVIHDLIRQQPVDIVGSICDKISKEVGVGSQNTVALYTVYLPVPKYVHFYTAVFYMRSAS